jgi:threonine/homoserine/homoserine lactone efflux protein
MQIPLIPLMLFSLTMAITPGPNNIMLTASGSQFGFRRTVPHILGINLGLLLILAACAFGLERVFLRWPVIRLVLQGLSLGYIGYLSYRIATSRDHYLEPDLKRSRPLRFYEAALFQIVNPKAFAIVTSLIATFSLPGADYPRSILIITGIMICACIPCVSLWTLFGAYMKSWLKAPGIMRAFNICMGLLTFGSVLYGMI